MKTTVVNWWHLDNDWRRDLRYVYMGRKDHLHDGYFGNPHTIGNKCRECGQPHERGETIALHRTYFINRLNTDPEFVQAVLRLQGKFLVCFCAPRPCHCDIIAEYLNQ